MIEIFLETWQKMSDLMKAALIDHELCHCTVEEDEDDGRKLTLVAHDLEEFRDIVDRHGFWREDVTRFAETCQKQLKLFDGAKKK